MAPYWLLLLFAGVSGLLVCELKKSRRRDLLFLAVMTVVMVAMAALRAKTVGVDTRMYMEYFSGVCGQNASFLLDKANLYWKEPAYSLLNFLISRVSQDPAVFMGIASGLIIVLRSVFLYRYSPSPWLSVVVYIGFGFFGYALCTIRQELAISVAMFALPCIQNRRLLPYLGIVALAALFHTSAWFLIPVYFLARLPLNKITLGIYCGGTLLILLFSEQMLAFVTKYVYRSYQPGSYYTQGRDLSTAVFPVLVFVLAFLMMKKLLAGNPANIVLINFSCYAALLFLLTLKHFIFQRIALLFLPAALLLLPEILNCAKPGGETRAELERLRSLDKGRQKQQRDRIIALTAEYKNQLALYYTTLGLLLVCCAVYYLFLLSANRLLLVPYVPLWMQ